MLTRVLVCMAIFILLLCSYVLFRTIAAQLLPESITRHLINTYVYHPRVEFVGRDIDQFLPSFPSKPNSSVDIYAKIYDEYGKIVQANLTYFTIPMVLIDGTPLNGTWKASIPPQANNSTIFYTAHFRDDLGLNSTTFLESYHVSDFQIVSPTCDAEPNRVIFGVIVVNYNHLWLE
jgi:hypothetical protein